MLQILVYSYEGVKLACGQCKQFTILYTAPAHLNDCFYIVIRQSPSQAAWN